MGLLPPPRKEDTGFWGEIFTHLVMGPNTMALNCIAPLI
jgi:hypothetical protein